MLLLERQSDGDIRLTETLLDDDIPRYPYAIISHTWERDGEEAKFEELVKGLGQSKAGYKKIKFCGEQAARDGLRCFWVDSCCIKKSNDIELSESINSMFRWYEGADKCYVYLSDISIGEGYSERLQTTWEEAFRGWTLQELLAPASVEFFSREGRRLGDKQLLEQQINEITGIPASALRGTPMC